MPQNIRDYLHAGLLIATPALLIAGVAAFWAAASFQGYLVALILLALAGCSFTGAQELNPERTTAILQALTRYFGSKNPKHNDTSDAA